MTTFHIPVSEPMRKFVEEQVALGDHGTAEKYIRHLIREDNKRAAQEHLEGLLMEGINSGPAIPVTPEFWTELRERVRQRLGDRHRAGIDPE